MNIIEKEKAKVLYNDNIVKPITIIITKIINDLDSIPTWLLVIGLKRRCLITLEEYNYILQERIHAKFEQDKEQRVVDFIDERRNVVDERTILG